MTTATPSAPIPATDPFTTLAAHFGMLLGVTDLEAVVGHAWAKMRLHAAWLHGEGVVWGFGLSVDKDTREVRVEPGLAIDALGHELSLPTRYCLDLAQWSEAHADHLPAVGEEFSAHVVARFRACLARPVPALVAPCEGATPETAYSRLAETVELFLLPGEAPRPPDRYPRLRAFLGGTDDPDARREREAVAAKPSGERATAWLDAVRRLAALDGIDRQPSGSGLFPGIEPDPARPDDLETGSLLLGNLLGLRLVAPEPFTAGVKGIEYTARPSHVDTSTLVELAARGAADAGGPRVKPETAHRDGSTIRVETTGPVLGATVAGAVTVHRFDAAAGWAAVAVTGAGYTEPEIIIELDAGGLPPDGSLLRVVLAGTGPIPVVDGVLIPLAGLAGGPPGSREDGHDAAFTLLFTTGG